MLSSPFALLIPLLVAFVLSIGLRFSIGPERTARFGGLALPIAFLIGWAVIVRPGWVAYDALGRVGHVVLGAALVGLVCDAWLTKRLFLMIGALSVLVVCAWTETSGGLWPLPRLSLAGLAVFAAAVAVGAVTLWRFDRLRSEDHPHMPQVGTWLLVSVMTALSLAAVAAVVGEGKLHLGAAVLAAALMGWGIWAWVSRQEVVAGTVLLTTVFGLLAIAWALLERAPHTAIGLALTALIPFSVSTANRIPLPKAGISRILAPLIFVAIATIPLGLAAILTRVVHTATG